MDWEEFSPRYKLKAAMEEGETMVIRPCFVFLSRTQEPPRLNDTSCTSDELSKAVVNKARKTLPIGNRKQLSILKNALVNHIASTKESIAIYNCNGDVNNDLNHVGESLEDFSEDSPKRASSIKMDAEDHQATNNVCSEDRSALVRLEPNSLKIQILTVLSKVDPKEMVTENDSKVMVNGDMSEDVHTEDFQTDHVYCMHNEENVSQPNCAEEGSSEDSGQLKHIATEHDYQNFECESHTMEPQDMDNEDVGPNNNSESLDSQVEAHATPENPSTFTENDIPSIDKVVCEKLSKSSKLDEPDEDPNLNELETVCQKNSELIQAEYVEEENQEMAEDGPNTDHDQLDNGSDAILDTTSEELRSPCKQDGNDECGVNPMEETQAEETDNCSKSNGETIEEDRIPNLTQEYSGEVSRKRTALEDDTEMEHMPKRSKVTTDVTTSVNEAVYHQQESPRLNGIINKTVEAAFQRQFGDIDGTMLMKQVRWMKSEVRKRDKDYEKFENLGSKLQSQLLCLEKMLSLAMQVVGKHLETPKNQEVSSEALVASQPQISMTSTAATTTTFASPSPPSSNPNSQQLKNKGMQSKPGMPRSSPVSSVGSNLNGAPPGLASGTAAVGGSPQRARLAVPYGSQTVAGLLSRDERGRAATSSATQMSSSAISGDERGRAIPPSDVPPALGGVPGGEERVRLVARPHFTAPRQATAALSSVGQMPPALPSVSVAPPPSSVARTPPVGAASQNHGSSNSHSTQSLPSALSRLPSSNASTTCSPGTQLPQAGAGRPSVAMQSPVANRNPASRFSGTGTTGVSPNAQVRTSSVPSHNAPRAAVPVGTGSGSASRLPGHSASGQGLSSQIVPSQQQQQASSRSPPSSGTAGTSSQALRRNSATSDAVIDLTEEDDDILITGMERGMRTVNRSQPGLSSTASQQRHLPGGPSSGSAQSKNMAQPSSRNTQVQQQQQMQQQQQIQQQTQQQQQQQQQQLQQHVSPQQLRGTQGQQNQGRVGQVQQIVPTQQQQQIRTSQVQSQQHRQHQPPQHQQQLSQLQQAQQQQQHPSQHQSQHAPSRISPATQHGMALSRAPLSQANHDRVVAQVHSQPAATHQQQHGAGKAPLGAVSHTSICVPVSMSQQVVDGNIAVHGRQPLAHRQQQQQQQQQQHLRPPPPLQRVVNSHVDTYGSMGPPPPYQHQQGGNGHMALGPAGTHMGPMAGQMIHQGPPPTQQQQLIHIPMQQIPPNVALAAVNFSTQMGMSSVPVYSSVGAMPVNGQPHYTQQQRLVVPSGLSPQMVNGLNGRVAQNMVRVSAPPSTHTQSQYQNSYVTAPVRQSYPAPLPGTPPPPPGLPTEAAAKLPPQRPMLKLGRSDNQNAIVLQWNVAEENPKCAPVESYHLFAYHEDPNSPMPSQWKKIGEVKALPLPMACTLTQFVCRSKYYFAVRAKDVYGRYGPFCEPQCTDFKTP